MSERKTLLGRPYSGNCRIMNASLADLCSALYENYKLFDLKSVFGQVLMNHIDSTIQPLIKSIDDAYAENYQNNPGSSNYAIFRQIFLDQYNAGRFIRGRFVQLGEAKFVTILEGLLAKLRETDIFIARKKSQIVGEYMIDLENSIKKIIALIPKEQEKEITIFRRPNRRFNNNMSDNENDENDENIENDDQKPEDDKLQEIKKTVKYEPLLDLVSNAFSIAAEEQRQSNVKKIENIKKNKEIKKDPN